MRFEVVTCELCGRRFHDCPMGGQPVPERCECGESLVGAPRETLHFASLGDAKAALEE